jgi:uncharacterized protein with PQ loop repeat
MFEPRYEAEVKAICQPLFNQLSFTYFHYFKIFDDGSFFILNIWSDWHCDFWQQKFKSFTGLPKNKACLNKPIFRLWDGLVDDDIVSAARDLCSLGHFMVNALFMIGMFVNAYIFVPQAYRIYKYKDAKALSLTTFLGFCIIQSFTIAYGYIHRQPLLMLGFTLSLLACGTVTGLIVCDGRVQKQG